MLPCRAAWYTRPLNAHAGQAHGASMTSRRTILKSIGLIGLAAAGGGKLTLPRALAQEADAPRWHGEPLARIAQAWQNARAEPTTDADVVAELRRDDLVRVRRALKGQQVFWNADTWLETDKGYLYASLVQPLRFHLPQPPVAELGEGRWAELIVPYSDSYDSTDVADPEAGKGRVYYGSAYRVVGLETGTDGRSYYRIKEQYQTIYIAATHLRLMTDAELAPLSHEVPAEEKKLVIDLPTQTITAYEYGEAVWSHLVSSGIEGYSTPEGTHFVWDKRISERMVASTASDDPDFYNLPGVPFVCYFTGEWVATHGTYWHNDYGRPRSHGCVNLPPDAARWVWRWTTPHYPLDELYHRVNNRLEGTRVVVKA